MCYCLVEFISGIYSWAGSTFENQCNPPHEQVKEKESYNHRTFDKVQHIHDKIISVNWEQQGSSSNGCKLQTQGFLPKIGKKARIFCLCLPIQHYYGSHRWSSSPEIKKKRRWWKRRRRKRSKIQIGREKSRQRNHLYLPMT